MKKIFIFLIAAISLTACSFFSNDEKVAKTEVAVVTATPCEDEVVSLKSLLAAKDAEVTQLRVDTARLSAEIRCMKQLADCGCNDAAVKVAPVKKQTAKDTYKKPASTPDQAKTIQKEPSETRTVKKQSTGTPNLSYLREGGEIIFCVRANGREDCYFPHYAIQNGVTFSNYASNQIKGYNWKVEPTNEFVGDYGVTKDGTFYVSLELVKTALQKNGVGFETLEIKAPYTGWVNKMMTQDGKFLVYKTR